MRERTVTGHLVAGNKEPIRRMGISTINTMHSSRYTGYT